MTAAARARKAAPDTLTPLELATLERLLERELSRALRALSSHQQEATRDMSVSDGGDLIDRTTAAASRERAGEFANREQVRLREIEESLRQLREQPERFGHCQECGGAISYARLEALPTTRYCQQHSR